MALPSSVLVTELCTEGSSPMFTVLVCFELVKQLVKIETGYLIVNTVLAHKLCIFDRPGVAGAVLQTASSFTD